MSDHDQVQRAEYDGLAICSAATAVVGHMFGATVNEVFTKVSDDGRPFVPVGITFSGVAQYWAVITEAGPAAVERLMAERGGDAATAMEPVLRTARDWAHGVVEKAAQQARIDREQAKDDARRILANPQVWAATKLLPGMVDNLGRVEGDSVADLARDHELHDVQQARDAWVPSTADADLRYGPQGVVLRAKVTREPVRKPPAVGAAVSKAALRGRRQNPPAQKSPTLRARVAKARRADQRRAGGAGLD
ncbi:hypothetical protein LG943_06730 [Streptomonospora sp. S1-112]|uniref:Uncharacterized protein n=1 Tax=Streptomonospora mangrovi TaxID=2883123 RepID=A0A9X3NTX3_9ACTN|nr:hypothetical protein [Streptomonospora mangrovi]MDA0564021.1 hypothetical protein [Streptomonospora mangrovi]